MANIARRTLLTGAAALALPGWRARAQEPGPFQLGVASGDPSPDGMVLWTRLALDPYAVDGLGGMPGADVAVGWELATGPDFTQIVRRGVVKASSAQAHSVHVEPTGLQPGREYYYRFHADGHTSPVGRTRTAPARDAAPGQLRFAVASCQQWEASFYYAHRFLAEDRPDLVLFLGDYIYERGGRGNARAYTFPANAVDLAGYRLRYSVYRTDPDLRAAHAAAPWLVVFDDHEVVDDWAGTDPAVPAERKQQALQAFYENMPIRRPVGGRFHRRVRWGNLAAFHLMDVRQYRSVLTDEAHWGDGDRTMLGAEQEQWLLDGLARRGARWDFLTQQVFFAHRNDNGTDPASGGWDVDDLADSWDGYTAARDRLVGGWVERRVRNPVVLTGDVHKHWAANVVQDGVTVGTEFVAGSISSLRPTPDPSQEWLADNPAIRFLSGRRGYLLGTLTQERLSVDYLEVYPTDVVTPTPARSVCARFTVTDGLPGLNEG